MAIKVFSYPKGSERRYGAIKYIRELIKLLNSEYRIGIAINVEDGHVAHDLFSKFLSDFFASCKENKKYVSILWLACFNWIIKEPDLNILWAIKPLVGSDFEFLKPFLVELQDDFARWGLTASAHFVALEGLQLKTGQGPWGATQGNYPCCTAVETTGYRESVFHECLHQLGISTEGYDEKTKVTLNECTDCWMQYNARKGTGLCNKHLCELETSLRGFNLIS